MELGEIPLPERREAIFLLIGLAAGAGLFYGATELTDSGGSASKSLVSFLENQTGQELEVITTEEAGEFYRVQVSNPQDRLVTYYVSQDGEMFTANMLSREDIQERNQDLVSFQQCLSNSGTVMFGNSSQRATQQQIQTLGGAQVVAPIYRDVSNTTVLRQAVQLGIQQVPAFYRNQTVIQGTQSLQRVEQFTGCSFEN